ncbi:MAG: LlaJI family restriction endonuclease [Desulfovibrionaceae bacterium]|nr:LlaJI family restriction endonuclease [Desulfovibrionaceae bacterium]
MISVFLREQKRYSLEDLAKALKCSAEKAVRILKRLKEYGVLKAVSASDRQKHLTDLAEEDIEIADIEAGESGYLYVFTFVGVITIRGYVLKCCPKYLPDGNVPRAELIQSLKQVLKVLEKYNAQEQIIRMYNETSGSSAFNMLAVMLFLLHDYIENGVYSSTQDIIEANGQGEILWDKTINETFTLLSGNRPYYPELLTRKRVQDEYDFFTRLHKCIITRCSKELRDAGLLELFDIAGADISDEDIEDFGDKEYVLNRIARELNVQFSTRKQLLLKTLYAYMANSNTLDNLDCFSMFGTSTFNLVWEKVCAEVLDNQLQRPISSLPVPLAGQYKAMRRKKLIDLIERPKWTGTAQDGTTFARLASDTLVPDIVSVVKAGENDCRFIIFDAKYYNLLLERHKDLSGNPGIESVTKQYLYQLAFQPFTEAHKMQVRNCFLMPTASSEIIAKGTVTLAMLQSLGLKDIQIRLLPAKLMYRHYLEGSRLDIRSLHL